ncbi:IgE-binding protein, partial [Spheniscus demersus]
VKRVPGIPYSPTGQSLVERARQILKDYLSKQKGEEKDPQIRLSKVLFTLNYLCLMGDREEPSIVIHHQNLKFNQQTTIPNFQVMYRDPVTGMWLGP